MLDNKTISLAFHFRSNLSASILELKGAQSVSKQAICAPLYVQAWPY
jgi:hypothetical protein